MSDQTLHLPWKQVITKQVEWGTTHAQVPTLPSPPQLPADQTTGTGTGTDPLSSLASAYMASLSGGGSGGGTAPIVLPAAPDTGTGAGINWTMIGAVAALALVGWAVWTWWMRKHGRKVEK